MIESRRPLGSAARTLGVAAAGTPLVAFSDDDSWWAPGALERAARAFETYPRLGLLAARIVVEPGGRLDPTSRAMRESPLACELALPGPPVLGFLACGAVARRSAVLECGGFHPRYGFGGEEHLLAVDLAAAGGGSPTPIMSSPTTSPRSDLAVRAAPTNFGIASGRHGCGGRCRACFR